MQLSRSHPDSQRGALLIVAMLLAAAIGISLVSYLHLSRTTLNVSNRAIYSNAAMNLSEQGIEEAIHSINQMVANPSYAWPSWETYSGTKKRRKWTGITLGQNTTAEFRVFVSDTSGASAPTVVSRALVTLGSGGAPIEKWVEVTLSKTSKFANGLVAKTSIIFNGNNATVDSWNSERNADGTPRGSPVPFSMAVRRDNGTVGSIAVASDAVLVKNADILGYVSNNANGDSSIDPGDFVGATGSILGSSSVPDSTWEHSNVDPSRVSTTFSATFDAVATPTASIALGAINNNTTLPRASDTTPNGTGEYAGYFAYTVSKVDLTNKVLTITDKVLLVVTETGNKSVATGGGSGSIDIGGSGALVVYTAGEVDIGGKGVQNGVDANGNGTIQQNEMGQPKAFQIFGTRTSGDQPITIAGNGLFSGVIYAPQGDVKITGNGAVSGSVVANKITLNGNAQFHYDESLGELGGGNPYRISKWKELTVAADRTAYSAALEW